MDDLSKAYLILMIAAGLFVLAKKIRRIVHNDEFEYLSVREQIAIANQTADIISEMEQLETDVHVSHADDMIVLHMEWIGRDNERHAVDLSCDGRNTISDCMEDICERQIHDLKNELSHQCAILQTNARRRNNRRRYVAYSGGEGTTVDETVSALRSTYLDG